MCHQAGELNHLVGTNPKCRDSYLFIDETKHDDIGHFVKGSNIQGTSENKMGDEFTSSLYIVDKEA